MEDSANNKSLEDGASSKIMEHNLSNKMSQESEHAIGINSEGSKIASVTVSQKSNANLEATSQKSQGLNSKQNQGPNSK